MLKKIPKASTCSGSRELPRVQDLSQDLFMTCDIWARAASLAALPRANAMWDDGVDGVLMCSLLSSSCVFASLSRFHAAFVLVQMAYAYGSRLRGTCCIV